MLWFRKREAQFERYKGFRTKISYTCKGNLKTALFDLPKPIDENFLEYLKPFGYPVLLSQNYYEIKRDGFFRLMIFMGRNSFYVKFAKNCDVQAKELIIQQVDNALNKNPDSNLPSRCPENALHTVKDTLSIDLTKCTFCLECI